MTVRFASLLQRTALGVITAAAMAGCAGAPPTAAGPASASAGATAEHAAESWVIKAEQALVAGHVQTAAQDYVKAAAKSSDPEIAERATVLAYHLNEVDLATRAAHRWHQLAPDAPAPHHFLAVLALRRHDLDAATGHFASLLNTKGRYDVSAVAGILSAEASPYEAFAVMRRLAPAHRADPEAQYALAWLAARADHTRLARDTLDHVLKAKPHWLKALMLRGRLLIGAGDTKAGLAPVRALTQASPDDAHIKVSYAELLFQADQEEAARKLLSELLARDPTNAEALLLLAADRLDQHDDKRASRYLTRLLETGKRNAQAYGYLGELAERQKDYPMALDWFQRVDRDSRTPGNELDIAEALAHIRDLDTARKYLAAARTHYPQYADELTIGEAQLLGARGDKQVAMKLLNAALAQRGDDTQLLYARGMLAEELGQHDKAIADLEKVVKLEPENTIALNALGYVLTEHTRHYRRARGYIKQALHYAPDNAAIIDSLGWLDFRAGDTSAALQALRRAHQIDDDPEISAHLVAALRAAGARGEADRVLSQALHKYPQAEALKKQLKPASP